MPRSAVAALVQRLEMRAVVARWRHGADSELALGFLRSAEAARALLEEEGSR